MVSPTGENLVFIVSTPRAGSTLLGAMLGSHPAIACPPEPWFLLRLAAAYAPGTHSGWYDDALAATATRAFLPPDDYLTAARAFAVQAYNAHLQRAGRTIFVDKTPRYYHILPFLTAAFPDARLIWLQRNPLAVAASFRSTWDIDPDVLTGARPTAHSFDLAFALHSLDRHFQAPSPRRLVVQFEQLVADPELAIQKVCGFVGIPMAPEMLSFRDNAALMEAYARSPVGDRSILQRRSVDQTVVDRWRTVLTTAEQQRIAAAVGPAIIDRMGYGADLPAGDTSDQTQVSAEVAAILGGSTSPADPFAAELDPSQQRVLGLIEHEQLADEAQRWRTAHAEASESRDAYRTAYETLAARERRRTELVDRYLPFARPLWRFLLSLRQR